MKKNSSMKELMQKLGTLAALIILCAIFCITMPDKFPKIGNIMNILKQASINCLIASGMLCCLITAGIDLSVGSNCVFCTCTIGVLVQSGVTNPVILVLAGLAVSTCAGIVNGLLLTRLAYTFSQRHESTRKSPYHSHPPVDTQHQHSE